MAACSFGNSSIRIPNLKLGTSDRTRFISQPLRSTSITTPIRYDGLNLSHKAFIGCRCLPAQTQFAIKLEDDSEKGKATTKLEDDFEEAKATTKLDDDSQQAKSSLGVSRVIPNSYEVEYLLSEICDTTSIAEFQLKLGEFELHVTRDLGGKTMSFPPPVSASVINTTVETPSLNVEASSPSLAITKVEPSSGGVPSLADYAADEGLAILSSPMVGFFRRSRTIKGKRAPPSCKEKQTVKEGQVICYIEQLGGEIPVESDVSGEVIKILREDGDPVGYGEALIAILPSFPGIKKLQ